MKRKAMVANAEVIIFVTSDVNCSVIQLDTSISKKRSKKSSLMKLQQ